MSNPLVVIIVVLLILMLVSAPGLGINHSFGYWPTGGLGTLLVVLIVVLLLLG